ncbi:hypothetical protein H7K45_12700 [Mycobacterium yunnanensis]|uniref:Uncharacterized protein n=1 Tax=Mycobacterium yunnanensis TaxID=368477 RepID=A0A9X3C1I3_9MYCO|nr:hypothetical protein [Mycobacterium yunnanensis]MCV7421403.1 hypothetical protein [Mycobacterium yunnanensis]
MEQPSHHRLHVLESIGWKDAVITLLEPRSPYRPWRGGADEGQQSDTVAFVLNTDPPSILAEVSHVDGPRELRQASFSPPPNGATVVDSYTLSSELGFELRPGRFDGDDADTVEDALYQHRYDWDPGLRLGHDDVSKVRTLLRFDGRCDGCNQEIDLTRPDARDQLFVHTVDAQMQRTSRWLGYPDWPAVMCRHCRDRMADEGHETFVDYKFSLNPSCPQCLGRRAREIFYGMPSDHENIPPWEEAGGCCPMSDKWSCLICSTTW